MNVVVISGNLGRDPQSRVTGSGKKVVNFTLAVNDGYGDNKKTYWFDVVVWEKQAELAEEYLSKGSKVLVNGRLQVRTYDDKEGKKVYKTEIVAYNIEFLDPAERGESVPEDDGEESQEVEEVEAPF